MHFTLASDGQRLTVLESGDGMPTTLTTWQYDAQNRLTSETRDVGNNGQDGEDYEDSYGFDQAGNRIIKTHNAVGTANDETVTSSYDARDRLMTTVSTKGGNASYFYNANGSTIESGNVEYIWDLRNRMVGLDADGDGDTADPAGWHGHPRGSLAG